MADSVAVTSAFVGNVENTIFTLTTLGNQAVEKGSVFVEPGVQKALYLPRFNTSADQLQAQAATPTSSEASDSFTYNERSITPLETMFYDEFNPRNFEDVWREFQPIGPLVDRVDNPQIQAAILEGAVRSVGAQLGKIIWQGDTTGATAISFFDGYLKIAAADGAIAPTPAGVITVSNVIAIMEATEAAIPDSVYEDPNVFFHMSTADLRLYKEAARALDFKGPNISEAGEDMFAGRAIRSYTDMAKNKILVAKATAGKDSNLWAAVDTSADDVNPKIARTQANSELFFIKILLKYAVNIPNPTECVLYLPA